MPYKNKCFSKCRNLGVTKCKKEKHCHSVKPYGRTGYKKTVKHCKLSSDYKLFRKNRTKKCYIRKIRHLRHD